MFKEKFKVLFSFTCIIVSFILTIVCIFFIDDSNAIVTKSIESNTSVTSSKLLDSNVDDVVDASNVSSIDNKKEDSTDKVNNIDDADEDDADEDVAEGSKSIVYDGMTLDELASKLDRSFKNELYGKGYLYASYSLEKGVDPYLAAAISLEETGCNWNCSSLVKSCNNVGGMVGSGCGGFSSWPTLDDGIRAFIDNIYKNYVAYGLTTADTMNPKYAENPLWANNVNNYIRIIKNN